MTAAALTVEGLKISVPTDEGRARILDYVDFELPRGHVLGIAGESGCGKSTLIKTILGILPRQAVVDSGSVWFRGKDLLTLPRREMRRQIRGSGIGFIPQDPYLALNPVFKVGKQLMEILMWNGMPGEAPDGRMTHARQKRYRAHLVSLLRQVQVPDPEDALERYPHQFSGGQRQRLLIAAALASQPELILADEPTTALDVTTQMQILKLLKELVEKFQASMLFVTHDFGVLAQICDSVSVMYAGQTIESGRASSVIGAPLHPYSRRLIGCHPERSEDIAGIPGQVPSPLDPPGGCRFNPRCDFARPACSAERPPLRQPEAGENRVACVLYE
ncbi:ABC transporter ATP-binding protein [Acuticoccus sediminis]|uniref:ABC transporter ATP-binding protein n=1 Tax=Acuticoccus sediminis TaxID=2184697 RepID=UPI001CFE83E5|nr:ABC transporter ATP-binding protein [Acuticoccus sediminis]